MLKISLGKKGSPAILVDGGTHGREWTSVISTLYFIESIAKNFSNQPNYVTRRDWHIIPVLNPDGYDYSLTKDRLWRKNRRSFSGNCYGVDLNTNFNYNWGEKKTSRTPCNAEHCGPEPFSEEETKAFKKLVDGTHYHGYISIHSAGTKVLHPWTQFGSLHSDFNIHQQTTKEIGLAMNKIANYHFTNGNVQPFGLRKSYGMAIDWMFNVKEIKNSYMIETRRHTGLDILTPEAILTAAKEVRAGLLRFAEILE